MAVDQRLERVRVCLAKSESEIPTSTSNADPAVATVWGYVLLSRDILTGLDCLGRFLVRRCSLSRIALLLAWLMTGFGHAQHREGGTIGGQLNEAGQKCSSNPSKTRGCGRVFVGRWFAMIESESHFRVGALSVIRHQTKDQRFSAFAQSKSSCYIHSALCGGAACKSRAISQRMILVWTRGSPIFCSVDAMGAVGAPRTNMGSNSGRNGSMQHRWSDFGFSSSMVTITRKTESMSRKADAFRAFLLPWLSTIVRS